MRDSLHLVSPARLVTCEQAAEFLSAWIDEEPVPVAIRRHLDRCSGCASQAEGLRALRSLLSVEQPEKDPTFVLRFRALRLAQERQAAQRFWRFWGLRLAPVAAAVAMLTVALVGSDRRDRLDAAELAILGEGSELGFRLEEDPELSGGMAWLDVGRLGVESRKER